MKNLAKLDSLICKNFYRPGFINRKQPDILASDILSANIIKFNKISKQQKLPGSPTKFKIVTYKIHKDRTERCIYKKEG